MRGDPPTAPQHKSQRRRKSQNKIVREDENRKVMVREDPNRRKDNMEEEKKEVVETPEEVKPTEPEVDYKALYEQTKAENERLRTSNTKASADVSKYKKQLSEVLSSEELAKREREEEQQKREELLQQYIERDRIRTYSDKYQNAGFSKEYADKMAELLPEGVKDEYFDNLKSSNADNLARLKAEALNNQPKPTTGTPPTPKDLGKTEEDKLLEAFMRGAGLT